MPLQPKRRAGVDRLAHGAAEADALLEAASAMFSGDQLSVKPGLLTSRMSVKHFRDDVFSPFWMSALSL